MSLRQRLPRQENGQHLEFIRSLPCVCCRNNIETEAAHLRAGHRAYGKRPTGKQQKPDDMFALPLCGRCHREQHSGNEEMFWAKRDINPFILALSLYAASGDHGLALEVIENQGRTR
jgi:hypothetical protein